MTFKFKNVKLEKNKEGGAILVFNYSKLRGKIVEVYRTEGAFAKALGYSNNTLSRKLNNKMRFTTDDIITIINLLNIPENEIGTYFFVQNV